MQLAPIHTRAAFYDSVTGWSRSADLDRPTTSSLHDGVTCGIDDSGTGFVVWVDKWTLYGAKVSTSGTYSAPIQISTGGAEFLGGQYSKDMVTGAVALAEFAHVVAAKYDITVRALVAATGDDEERRANLEDFQAV